MKKVLLVISSCLLMSNIANAQYAWVLWEKKELGNSTVSWTLQQAFPDYESCIVASETYSKGTEKVLCARGLPEKPGIMREGDEWKLRDCFRQGSTLFGSKYEGSKYLYLLIFNYECFPDTIDPRK